MRRQAAEIRKLKDIIKEGMKDDEPMQWFQRRLDESRIQFRYDYVTYSILNGKVRLMKKLNLLWAKTTKSI